MRDDMGNLNLTDNPDKINMKIFQNSVLNKYLKTQDEKKIDEMYSQFTAYFHNAEIQENIRNSKEEQFQEGFLRELFVKILGYTLNPKPNFNLTTELKNEKGAKKTDGAILKNGKALAVIELKGTNTKDLDKINEQAFNYKNNHTDCVYVITSNFEKLRFFIHNAVAHIEFNLFKLTKEEFKILWLCINAENLLGGVPAKIKEDSIIVEENVTKQLYKDYSTFKHELWQNICKNRPDLDKLLLFKKTQKLLDRFLFIFFAEDSGLLPPNSISRMVERFEQLIELDAKKPLYEIFKQYFGYINKGRKGKTAQDDIFAYNGGLFLPDKILDNLIIDDKVLKPHVLTMTAYDFQSDIDVNILGHIFENSLNEIENVTAQLEGQELDKSKTKRKKDGVFYTPKYITKYIVENTVGKLCEEKKTELKIIDEEYAKGRKNRKKATVKTLYDNLQEYRNWLLEITICDPACGSGAFLNQALEFLINEHAYIDELQADLLEASLILQDVSNHVLEKNIFGVDINEESVEIAKLSLWLRTAQRGRKLTSLNNNIKCGNSLIDDPEVAGEKAFNWQNEFPQVFKQTKTQLSKEEVERIEKTPDYLDLIEQNAKLAQEKAEQSAKLSQEAISYSKKVYELTQKQKLLVRDVEEVYGINKGGFDVIIGNPPYGILIDKTTQNYYQQNFPLTQYKTNLYILFIERMLQVFDKGVVHFIIPKSLLFNTYYEAIRRELISKTEINEIYTITEKVFEDAEVGGSLLLKFTIKKKPNIKNIVRLTVAEKTQNFITEFGIIKNNVPQNSFLNIANCEISITSSDNQSIINKLHKLKPIKNYYSLKNGLNPGNIKHILISNKKTKETHKPIIWGKEISRYGIIWGGDYIEYDEKISENITLEDLKSKQGMNKQNRIDFALRKPELFENKKIVVRKTGDALIGSIDKNNFYFDTLVHGIYEKEQGYTLEALLAILNSHPVTAFYRLLHDIKGKVFAKISLDNLGSFPIPDLNANSKQAQQTFIEKADLMLSLNKKLQTEKSNFLNTLQEEKGIVKITKKLDAFYKMEYDTFKKELAKQKVKISLGNENNEWREYFKISKQKINDLQNQINQTDNEIDKMVYELYELTEKEIEIVENSVK